MAASPTLLILLTLVSTVTLSSIVVFGVVQNIPNNGIFNHTMKELSTKYPSAIMPANYAFAIWGLIFLFQYAWLGYAYSTMCRSNGKGLVIVNPVTLPKKFHLAYSLSCAGATFWYFTYTSEQLLLSALVLVSTTLLGFIALFINLAATVRYQRRLQNEMPADLICIRVLVQNGVCMFSTWSLYATLVSVTSALAYDPKSPYHMTSDDAGSLCLYILGVFIIAASVLENTKLFFLTKYLYSWYFVLIWGLAAIIVRFPDTGRKNTIITIVLLCATVVCLAAKITVYCLAPAADKKSKKYTLLDEEDMEEKA